MREFSIELDNKDLYKGLRKQETPIRNGFNFYELKNLEPVEGGLQPVDPVKLPFDPTELALAGLDLEWPFPQLFIGKNKILLASDVKIFSVNPDDWSFNEITIYDIDNGTATFTINPGRAWQFVDLGEVWFMTNGVDTVFNTKQTGMISGQADKVWGKHGLPIGCGTFFKGKIVFGGFDYTQFWSSDWESFWTDWTKSEWDTGLDITEPTPEGDKIAPIGKNWIWWSTIGGGDSLFLFNKNFADVGVAGGYGYSTSKPLLFELLKRNEMGFAPLPFVGAVRVLKPLGKYIIAYGDSGVLALEPVFVEFAHTYAFREIPKLQSVGIAGEHTVSGNLEHHVFLDKSGFLWELGADLSVVPLGYREYLFDMVGQEPLFSFSQNPHDLTTYGRFYLSRRNEHFILTKAGLLETGQAVTSAFYHEGATIGIADELAGEEGKATFDTFDFFESGIKSLESVRIDMDRVRYSTSDNLKVTVAVDYRMHNDQDYTTTVYRPVNHAGWVYFPVSGVDFRLRIKVNNFERVRIGRVEINGKFQDRNFRRSVPLSTVKRG